MWVAAAPPCVVLRLNRWYLLVVALFIKRDKNLFEGLSILKILALFIKRGENLFEGSSILKI